MRAGYIQQFVQILQTAFQQLQAPVPPEETEKMAITIDRALTMPGRNYHTAEHILSMVDPADPIRSLAALFHDIVYYQVDRCFVPDVYRLVGPYVAEKGEAIYLISAPGAEEDLWWQLTLDIFGFTSGQKMSPFAGLNEFTSALYMAKRLEGYLNVTDLLNMVVCVEATIPFRLPNQRGQTVPEIVADRLAAANQEYGLGLSQEAQDGIIQKSVVFMNQDVANFGDQNTGLFLDSTWKLLTESNVPLRSWEIYTIRDYRRALQNTEGFFITLKPEIIFRHYKGVPPEATWQQLLQLGQFNLEIGRAYLGAKLLAAALLEALAEVSGGDVPIALFMGDLPKNGERVQRLEDFLPSVDPAPQVDPTTVVYRLLETGRSTEIGFDIKNSPLAAFIYKLVGPDRMTDLVLDAKEMFAGQLTTADFLKRVPPSIMTAMVHAISQMAPTRADQLRTYLRQ